MESTLKLCFFLCVLIAFLGLILSSNTCGYSQRVLKGVFSDGFIFTYFTKSFVHQCAAHCVMHTICASFNFDKTTRTCYLSNETSLDGSRTLRNNTDFLYSDIENWPKSVAGSCFNHECGKNFRCIVHRDQTSECARVQFRRKEKSPSPEYKFFRTVRSWHSSKTVCENKGYKFVIVNNDEEHTFIKNILYALGRSKIFHWLGGQSDNNGEWAWWDGSPVTFTNWADGQPNGTEGTQPQCLGIMGNTGWANLLCSRNTSYICWSTQSV